MEIIIGKLANSIPVIGKLDSENNNVIESYGVQIMGNQNNPNQFNAIILPLMAPLSDKPITISLDKFLFYTEVPDNLKAEYAKINSNIILPINTPNLKEPLRPVFGAKK